MAREVFRQGRGDRVGVPNVAIVITDGKSTRDQIKTEASALEARAKGIRMMAVGITRQVGYMPY